MRMSSCCANLKDESSAEKLQLPSGTGAFVMFLKLLWGVHLLSEYSLAFIVMVPMVCSPFSMVAQVYLGI